ncbi:Uma2 family endonuclease [Sphaerisporangium corydalis]|uniref:Uma2 family endonuclease n=1 Tax=Sphaerisporangium corydalis TaxID=1441875 RepID=A0ABV9EHQ9_9ACTN|nr:Uma2 family endonuclease [Sphaerisporangium corydalis]
MDRSTVPPAGDPDVSPVEEVDPEVVDEHAEQEAIYRDLAGSLDGRRKVELVDGRVVVREMPTIEHARIVYRLLLQLIPLVTERGWEILPDIAIFLGPQMDRYRPDATVVPAHPPMWQPDEVYGHATHLVAEVVSKSSAHDDHVVKPGACAVAGVPLYLVVDAFEDTARLFSHPREGEYSQKVTVALGEPLKLPEPWGLSIDTGRLAERSA